MLSLERVGKTYPNGVHALEAVNLDVEPGEIVAVIGGSGCGKSTLLRAVSGLDMPSQGRVELDGTMIATNRSGSSSRSRGCCRGLRSLATSALDWKAGRRRSVPSGLLSHSIALA